MLTEVLAFLGVAFIVVVALLWRSRRGGTGDADTVPKAQPDRPEPVISSESLLGPHRNLGRPFHVDRGERPPDDA